jgi:hypothetical protein
LIDLPPLVGGWQRTFKTRDEKAYPTLFRFEFNGDMARICRQMGFFKFLKSFNRRRSLHKPNHLNIV